MHCLMFNMYHFNAIELCFRALKRMTYNKLYNNNEEIKSDVINFLEKDELKNNSF